MAENNWHRIWNSRVREPLPDSFADERELFVFMKRLNGFDSHGGNVDGEAFFGQLDMIKERLCKFGECKSLFEVGCGSGANLLMFGKMGWKVGGIDYSEQLIEAARRYLPEEYLRELICGGADTADTLLKYDAVLSNSVFSYFTDLGYAKKVLSLMERKCLKSIMLIDIYDIEKKDAFTAYRKARVKDYEKLYEGLPKLFYPRSFFEDFAAESSLSLEFSDSELDGYWNNDFVYNVCFYRR